MVLCYASHVTLTRLYRTHMHTHILMRVHTHALADLFSQHTGAAGGAVVRSDCTLLVTSLKNMYCAIRQLEVTFSVSAGLTHHSFSHIKSNHLFLFFSAPRFIHHPVVLLSLT